MQQEQPALREETQISIGQLRNKDIFICLDPRNAEGIVEQESCRAGRCQNTQDLAG